MASALTSPYKDDTLAEIVPNVAKIAGKLAQSSVITDRRRVRIVPQSGQSYTLGAGGTGTVNILLQDGQAYLDPQSACVSFTVSITAGQTGGSDNVAVLDDGAWSVFRRLLVSLNSTQVDDIDRVAVRANQEIYATVPEAWYNGPGSHMGLWKHSKNGSRVGADSILSADSVVPKYNPFQKIASTVNLAGSTGAAFANIASTSGFASLAGAALVSTGNTAAEQRYSFPLSLLSHVFRSEQLLPLRNMGQLMLQFQLASAQEAALNYVAGTGVAAGAAPTVAVSDFTLETDFCTLHPSYLEMMDKMMADPQEDGIMLAYDAHTVGSAPLTAGGDQSAVFTKASQNLRSIHVIAQPATALGADGISYGKQSTFANPAVLNIQYRAGSLYFPAIQSVGLARMAMDLFASYGSPDAVDKASIVDITNYNHFTSSAAAGSANPVNVFNKDGATLNGFNQRANTDCWAHGYCFDRLKRAKLEGEDLDGISTLSTSGSQIVAQIGLATAPQACTLTGILRYTRIIKVHGGATQILG